MNTLERIARNIARLMADHQYGSSTKDADRDYFEAYWPEHLAGARAILTAIREPTNDLFIAGKMFWRRCNQHPPYRPEAGL